MRYLAGAVCLSYAAFAAYRFSAWQSASPDLPFGVSDSLPENWANILTRGALGAALLLLAGIVGAYFLVFVNAKASDYLISIESEMRKVYWPQIKPWFSWSSELWGSTYVVILLTVLLAAFIKAIDLALAPLAKFIFEVR